MAERFSMWINPVVEAGYSQDSCLWSVIVFAHVHEIGRLAELDEQLHRTHCRNHETFALLLTRNDHAFPDLVR